MCHILGMNFFYVCMNWLQVQVQGQGQGPPSVLFILFYRTTTQFMRNFLLSYFMLENYRQLK